MNGNIVPILLYVFLIFLLFLVIFGLAHIRSLVVKLKDVSIDFFHDLNGIGRAQQKQLANLADEISSMKDQSVRIDEKINQIQLMKYEK